MPSGTVVWFNETRGYGFIQPQTGGRDVFVHLSAVRRSGLLSLHPGQRVAFETVRGRQGLEVIELRLLGEPHASRGRLAATAAAAPKRGGGEPGRRSA
jgi:CspA family cold shock protein